MVPHFLGFKRNISIFYLDDEKNIYLFEETLKEIQIFIILREKKLELISTLKVKEIKNLQILYAKQGKVFCMSSDGLKGVIFSISNYSKEQHIANIVND